MLRDVPLVAEWTLLMLASSLLPMSSSSLFFDVVVVVVGVVGFVIVYLFLLSLFTSLDS